MTSSTSSSDHRAPLGPWGRTWALALALALVPIGSWEAVWRARGLEPSCRLTSGSFSLHWTRALAAERDDVVLIGSSRFQLGLDPALVAEASGRDVILLSMSGGNPLPIAEAFARDADFAGTVVIEVMPTRFFTEEAEPVERARSYVTTARQFGEIDPLEERLKAALYSRFAVLHPSLAPQDLVAAALRDGGLPGPPYLTVRADGFIATRWELTDPAAREREWTAGYEARVPLPEAAIAARMAALGDAIDRIEARGGEVLLLRMPSSGTVREVEERLLPRADYYERWVPALAPAVHFEDEPTLADLPCPDGSHLGADGVDALSRWLGARLAR